MAENTPSRREFLRHTGILAAAAAVPLAPPDRQPPNLDVPDGAPKKLGWAIMGLGELALDEVLPAFGVSQHSRPTALVSGHLDKAMKVADRYGIEAKHLYDYDNFDRIIDDPTVDIVYNILPNHMHAEFTIRALRAGKHVLCEKPLAATADEARRMCETAKQTNRKLMTAYRLRYDPFHQMAIEQCQSGALGKLKLFEANNTQSVKAPNIRLSRKTAGGPLGDVGIYCLNAARYLTGEEPIEVDGIAQQPADDPRFAEVHESVSFHAKFPSGVIANCTCSFGSARSNRLRMIGDQGWLEMEQAFAYRGQQLQISKGNLTSQMQITPVNQFAAEMDHFSACVMQDKPPLTPGEDGLRDMILIEAIHRAVREGKRVPLAGLDQPVPTTQRV